MDSSTPASQAAYPPPASRIVDYDALPDDHILKNYMRWRVDASAFTDIPEAQPAALSRDDGELLLYQGRINWLSGLPAKGKTWVALVAVRQFLNKQGVFDRAGNRIPVGEYGHVGVTTRVVYIDHEDKPGAFGERSLLVGGKTMMEQIKNPDRFAYVQRDALTDPVLMAEAVKYATPYPIPYPDFTDSTMVVIDSASGGGCPIDGNGDQTRDWIQEKRAAVR